MASIQFEGSLEELTNAQLDDAFERVKKAVIACGFECYIDEVDREEDETDE